tara:strand:- start:3078 stop:3839 length:762 start_codon:yes stop_codon:yes gene_type:complete
MNQGHRFGGKWSDAQLSFFITAVRQNPEINGHQLLGNLQVAFENPDYTSPTTLYKQIELARIFIKQLHIDPDDLDDTEQWKFKDEVNAEDARLILNALPDVLKELGGQKTSFTQREAWWLAKIKRTAPSIDGWKAYLFAREFIGRGDGDTTDLYLLLDVYDGDFLEKSKKLHQMFEAKVVPLTQGVTELQLLWRMEHITAMTDTLQNFNTSDSEDEALQDINQAMGDIHSAMTQRTINTKIDALDDIPTHDIP